MLLFMKAILFRWFFHLFLLKITMTFIGILLLKTQIIIIVLMFRLIFVESELLSFGTELYSVEFFK